MVTIENNKLIFSGRIDSSNAAQFEEELFGLYKGGDAVIDAKDLTYISSAGLRVIMKLRKQTANVTLENVSLDVYNVFEMAGAQTLSKFITEHPEMTKLTIRLEHSLANQMWNILMLTYFKDSPMNNPELNMKRLGAFSLFRAGTHMGDTPRGRELAPRILAAMRQGLFSNIDGVEKLFSMPL